MHVNVVVVVFVRFCVSLPYNYNPGCLGGAAVRVGLVIERSLVRLPAGALSSQLGQLSLPSLRVR